MAFERLNTDLSYISKLPDEPNETLGLSAAALKAEFDRAGLELQRFINTQLLPAMEGQNGAQSLGVSAVEGLSGAQNVQQALEKLEKQIKEASVGVIPDLSLEGKKLADAAVSGEKIAPGAVGREKLSPGAVDEFRLADAAVTAKKIAPGAVGKDKLAANSVLRASIENGAVTGEKLASGAVTENKIGYAAVTGEKLAEGAVSEKNISGGAVTKVYRASLGGTLWQSEGDIFVQSLSCPGLKAGSQIIVDISLGALSANEARSRIADWGLLLRAEGGEGTVRFYMLEKPENSLDIRVLEVKK